MIAEVRIEFSMTFRFACAYLFSHWRILCACVAVFIGAECRFYGDLELVLKLLT